MINKVNRTKIKVTEKERFWHVREFILWHYSKLVTVTVAVRIEGEE